MFAAMSVIWGIPYLLIKVAVDEVWVSFAEDPTDPDATALRNGTAYSSGRSCPERYRQE